jgi:thiamine biosynthesis lipoprotein
MSDEPKHWNFSAIGTLWHITLYTYPTTLSLDSVFESVQSCIREFTGHYSRFESTSLVTRIAENPGTYTLPRNSTPLLTLYKKIYDITDGKVTPLIGTLMEDVGYDAAYSLVPKRHRHTPPSWSSVFSPNLETMTTSERVMLDIGAAGKGYLVDLVAAVLHAHDIHNYTIDAGADILHTRSDPHAEPLLAALESPFDTTLALGTVPIHNKSLCASAGNRRSLEFW